MDLTYKPPFHFIGIGGSGMAPLAELAQKKGFSTQGSESQPNETTKKLESLGIKIFGNHVAENLGVTKTVVYSSAVSEDNIELKTARAKGLTVIHRSDFLQFLMAKMRAITVAGTHGKTTTSALITHVLENLGEDPWAAIGGKMLSQDSAARSGGSDLFVAEADESDGSLVKYSPYISVLTNIDSDHLNNFKGIEGIKEVFLSYLNKTNSDGVAVVGWDNSHSREIGGMFSGNRLTYGFVLGCDVRAVDYKSDKFRCTFKAVVERDVFDCQLNLMGKFNVANALCALAVVRALELNVGKAAQALSTFAGVDRRQNLIYSDDSIKVFDDYAHNPGKVAACIGSLKEAWPDWELNVVYQPHRFSRLSTMYDETVSAFSKADRVFMLPVYSAGEAADANFTPEKLAKDVSDSSKTKALPILEFGKTAEHVLKNIKKPAIILTMGAGDVWKVGLELRTRLNGDGKIKEK